MEETLSASLVDVFETALRVEGERRYSRGDVVINLIGELGANASVVDENLDGFDVYLDFLDLDENLLGVACDCHLSQEDTLCSHIWAVIQALGEYECPWQWPPCLDVLPTDPHDIEYGRPLAKSRVRPQRPTGGQTNERATPAIVPFPEWKQKLQTIAQTQSPKADPREIPTLYQQAMSIVQHWFIVDLSDFARNQPLLIHAYQSTRLKTGKFGKPRPISLTEATRNNVSDQHEAAVFSLLDPVCDDKYRYYSFYERSASDYRLPPAFMAQALRALTATNRFAWRLEDGSSLDEPSILQSDGDEPWSLHLAIELASNEEESAGQETKWVTVTPTLVRTDESISLRDVVGISSDGVILRRSHVGYLPVNQAGIARGFHQTGTIKLPLENIHALMEQLHIWRWPECRLDPRLPIDVVAETPKARLHLTTPTLGSQTLQADVLMRYGETSVNAITPGRVHWDEEEELLVARDLVGETALLDQLPPDLLRFIQHNKSLSLNRDQLSETVITLSQLGWEVVADGNVFRTAGEFKIDVISGQDWFDVNATIDFDGQSMSLPELLKAQRKGEKYIVLDDGSHGLLPEAWLKRFENLERAGTTQQDAIRYEKNQALLLESMLADEQQLSLDKTFKDWCKKLNSFSGVRPAKAPRTFKGTLRDYQAQGLGWLNFLNEFKLGGCLADDMGLGKTIQVLALLEKRRTRKLKSNEHRLPSLVVAPKSLIFNWIEEASRFAPNLKLINYTGTERKNFTNRLDSFDVVLTTYGTLRIDAVKLKEVPFDYVILDEAQAIKNPDSLAARASRLMDSQHRLVMTGTPIENHLGDLWSLFDFINPGMLNHSKLLSKSGLATNAPNVTAENDSLKHIANAIRPFVLRRTKKEVLSELPEKSEQTLYCDMERKQKKLYDELKEYYRKLILNKVETDGLAKSKIHVLEALLRLRQAACDPRLVKPKCGVRGIKLDLLQEQLEEVTNEGHKALVFSQFTSLLSLLKRDLDAKKLSYEYLDGKTRNRKAVVDRFQDSSNCNLFLISLKAGGAGLNLTSADYVYILDPWWNPAVEAQAIDRAHRIGQVNPVTAYRMIARETVEEKIVQLQNDKRQLADAIITEKQSLISELTSDDLRMLFD